MSKQVEDTASDVSKTTPSILDNMESYLDSLESAPKPWFLSTTVIYKAVKDSITAIPMSKDVFEKAVGGISAITTYINDKTSAGIQVFDLEKSYELLGQLDGLLADRFIVMDDGLDGLRAMLSVNLKQLIGSILKQKEFIEKTATEKIDIADKEMKARYEQVAQLLDKYLQAVKDKYPERYTQAIQTYEQVISKADEYKTTVDKAVSDNYNALRGKAVTSYESTVNTVFETQSYLLKTAQPYVQDAVARTQPYIAQAQPYVEPLIEKAKPYIEPVHEALQNNAYVGPYVKSATDTAIAAIEEAKNYCGLQAVDGAVEPSTVSEPAKVHVPEQDGGVAAH